MFLLKMNQDYNFNAPQFLDFNHDLQKDENVDSFFDIAHEEITSNSTRNDINDDRDFDQEFFSPIDKLPERSNAQDCLQQSSMRRSMSMGDITNLRVAVKKMNLNDSNSSVASSIKPESRYNSSAYLNKLSQPKCNKKYISMAEAIHNFHNSTPERFRSKPKKLNITSSSNIPVKTSPHSPPLCAKTRTRTRSMLSSKEQEELEIEELKKFKIKANPLNTKILQEGPKLVPVEKKQLTYPKPFNLTEVSQKAASVEPEVFQFHAKPVPKSLSKPFKPVIKQSLYNLTRNGKIKAGKINKDEEQNGVRPFKPQKTQLAPFSFESRDKQIIKKKEQFIQKVLEEEKKAREFHAQPLPKYFCKSPQNNSSMQNGRQNSSNSVKSNKSDDDKKNMTFKARPAKVLQMDPFVPKKLDHPLTEITEFQLNTNVRAKQRAEFDQKLKNLEELMAKRKQTIMEHQKQLEQEEIAKLRKEAEHKAQPIKHYKEFKIVQSSKQLTVPASPRTANHGRIKNKENNGEN